MAESQGRLNQLKRMFSLSTMDDISNRQDTDVVPACTTSIQEQVLVPTVKEEDDMPYPLTYEEAIHFLEKILHIPQPLELLERDPLEFLNTFLLYMNTEIPFTNIPICGRIFDEDYYPSFEEGKKAMFSRQGGNCLIINFFTKAILDRLGYNTFHIGANNPGDREFDTHISTIVCDITAPGSMHLVDPGMVRPFYQPIPLDFDDESEIYQFSYLKCKLFKGEHGMLHLCSFIPEGQTAPSPVLTESKGMAWKILISYRPHLKRSRAYFYQKIQDRLGFPSSMPEIFKGCFLCTRKDETNLALGHQDELFVLIYMHEDESMKEFSALTREEFLNFMQKEFPQFPGSLIEKAIKNVKYFKNLYKFELKNLGL